MGKGLWLGLIAALILSARTLDAQVPNFYRGPAPAYSPLVRAAFGALLSGPSFFFTPQADGGGDGGSDGGSSDGSSSDGSSSADGGDAAAAAAAQDAPSVSDPTTDPTTDPATVNNVSPLDAIQAIPTKNPRGEEVVAPDSTNARPASGPGGVVGAPRPARFLSQGVCLRLGRSTWPLTWSSSAEPTRPGARCNGRPRCAM